MLWQAFGRFGGVGAPESSSIVIGATAPSIRGTGAWKDTAAVDATVILPTYAENDLILLFCESTNNSLTAPAGYNAVTGTPAGSVASQTTIFWKIASASESNPTVGFGTNDHSLIIAFTVQGVNLLLPNPFDASYSATSQSGESITVPGITTTYPNSLVFDAVGTGTDINVSDLHSAWANASLSSYAERAAFSTNTDGGGALGIASGVKVAAGSVDSSTVSVSLGTSGGCVKLAIIPV